MSDIQQSNKNIEDPLLIQIRSGSSASNTVFYKNRYLYSKYNPSRSIEQLIENQVILQGSIILICSPCLWYGYDKLKSKTAETSTIIAVEEDIKLLSLAASANPEVPLYSKNNLMELDSYLRLLSESGRYRRIVRIDFSAGTNLNPDFYKRVFDGCQNIISTFWKNRITISKMGKLYSKNLIKNLPKLSYNRQLSDLQRSITKPILVVGAGESLDKTFIQNIPQENFYIICVDMALESLLAYKVKADAVVAVESQFAIQKSYIGAKNQDITLFADLTSRIEITDILNKDVVFFASEYTREAFFTDLVKNNIIKSVVPPLGSVGLYAIYIALYIRKDTNIPVYFTGMDFSYSIGNTHAKSTAPHRNYLNKCTRLQSVENYDASFNNTHILFKDKENNTFCTSPVLKGYAQNFICNFINYPNIFDIGLSGLNLTFKKKTIQEMIQSSLEESISTPTSVTKGSNNKTSDILIYLEERKKDLFMIKDLLTQGTKGDIETTLPRLLLRNSYLYLHFPDGYRLSLDESFLNRIRAEVDSFIKTVNYALKICIR